MEIRRLKLHLRQYAVTPATTMRQMGGKCGNCIALGLAVSLFLWIATSLFHRTPGREISELDTDAAASMSLSKIMASNPAASVIVSAYEFEPNFLNGGYGPFSKGMHVQRAVGIPKFRQPDGKIDYERLWDFMPYYSQVVWNANTKPDAGGDPDDTIDIEGGNEQKFFFNFANSNEECRLVTMGVGGVVEAETKFQKRYPQCHFLGIDPDAGLSRAVYESLGARAKFVEAAVYAKSGPRLGHFWRPWQQGDTGANPGYNRSVLQHTGIDDLLRKHFTGEMIDLLDLDVEGAEYSIIGWLTAARKKKPTICQVNIEFHHPVEKFDPTYNYATFFAQLEQLMKTHALLNTGKNLANRNFLVHLVNVAEPACLKKLTRY